MTQSPARPPLALTIGVIGHRPNRIPEAARAKIHADIAEVLAAIGAAAEAARASYGAALKAKGYPAITTEIVDAPPFYFAEDYHQQYLAKNPNGYCGLGGTGVSCQIGTGVAAAG